MGTGEEGPLMPRRAGSVLRTMLWHDGIKEKTATLESKKNLKVPPVSSRSREVKHTPNGRLLNRPKGRGAQGKPGAAKSGPGEVQGQEEKGSDFGVEKKKREWGYGFVGS